MTETKNSTWNKADINQLIVIKGCIDCPFNYEYDMAVFGFGCRIDTKSRTIKESKKFRPITPKWCPVKKGSVVVKYGG